jgi:uncharacterized protein involved in exopolysaccharide biosynthesis
MNTEALSFSELLGLLRRRSTVFAHTFVALFSLTILLAFGLPAVYESTGTILIEQQNIPSDLVQSTITSYADERIQVISQRVMSTDNLVGLINKYNLYSFGSDDEPVLKKAKRLEESIVIEPISADVYNPSSGRPGRATIAFTVTVRHDDQKIVHQLATELTELFLEENKRSREEQTLETVSFLQSQSAAYQSEIDRIEAEIATFKSDYQGMLPENVSFNMQALEREERKLDDVRSEIRTQQERIRYLQDERRMLLAEAGGAVDRMAELQEEYARVSAKYAPNHPDVLRIRREIEILRHTGGESDNNESAQAIAQVRQELAAARERYSDDHPDVRSLQRTLTALEEQASGEDGGAVLVSSPAVRQIDSELRERRALLSALEKTQSELNREISEMEADLEGVPEIERQYRMLTRRYEDAVDRHDQIQAKLATARMSSRLEVEQLGEKFTPIDPPRLPSEPASPNRLGILALGVVLGGALAIGALALAEVSDTSVRSARDVRDTLGVPPLASIPVVETPLERRRRILRVIGNISFAGLMISIAAIGAVYLGS